MKLVEKCSEASFQKHKKNFVKKDLRSFFKQRLSLSNKNISLLSFVGVTTIACNASQDEQCYGGFGVIVGSICASQDNVVVNTEVKLTTSRTNEDFYLSLALDADGNEEFDTVEFTQKNKVIGTK